MTATEKKGETTKPPVAKEKLHSIMEAASALTALGDEDDSEGSRPGTPKNTSGTKDDEKKGQGKKEDKEDESSPKRYLPEHKKPDAAPTFPEKVSCR